METIIIGKPAIDIYLPLQEFPQEGDTFTIKNKIESVGNVAATSACLLGKWNVKTHFTGVVGNDGYAEKIRDTFKEYNVETKFLETNFEYGTTTNYYILNAKTGGITKVLCNNPDVQLVKYKYDFTPSFAIIDGTDIAGTLALLNNNANCKTVFYGRVGDKDSINLSKRCTWAIVTEAFATMMTKMEVDGDAEGYVNLYQKIVDSAGKSNYIVILNNHKILYSEDGKVKMLPEMKINVTDTSSFDSVFVGAFSYAMMQDHDIDDAIKLANTAAAISISKIGEVSSIPTLDETLDNSGLRDKFSATQAPVSQTIEGQEPTPLNPNYQSDATQEVPNTDTVSAFESAPVTEQATSVEPTPTPQSEVVETPTPQSEVVETPAPKVEETNMFDNPPTPEVNMFDNPNNNV